MFQIEPILWLQSWESPWVIWFFWGITNLGYTAVYVALILVVAFAVGLRQSLSVLLALLIAGILVGGLKPGLGFPRPSDVDARIIVPGVGPATPLVDRGAGTGFWDLPSSEARIAVRGQSRWSYGLPSGHVASASAFFLGLAIFFRSRDLMVFAAAWIPLMALSRMFLGRHFLGDVLGGFAVGVLAVGAAGLLIRPRRRAEQQQVALRPLIPLGGIVLSMLSLMPFVPLLDAENLGRLVGLSVAWSVILLRGFPSDEGAIWQRATRVLIAVILYLAVGRLVDLVLAPTGWDESRWGTLIGTALATGVTLAGTVAACRRLSLYRDYV